MDKAKSKPKPSAFSTIVRLRSKLGLYWGDVVEISQPLLPMGMKTPSCIAALSSGCDEFVPAAGNVAVLVHYGIPHGDVAQPLPHRAAVADIAGLFHQLAEGRQDVGFRRL